MLVRLYLRVMKSFDTEDTQQELYVPEHRENVEFDKFEGYEKSAKKFMDTLENFENSNNPFFDLIVYGLMCKITREKGLMFNSKKKRQRMLLEKICMEGW